MARVTGCERGAVYVEFLLAFFPLFLLFLAVCQLALIGAAEAVVSHAAFCAARSAVVVLEESPERFDGAPRGDLSAGRPSAIWGTAELLGKLGFAAANDVEPMTKMPQAGARMVPIKMAALFPLLPFAPYATSRFDSVGAALDSAMQDQVQQALSYTRTATRVSIHGEPGALSLVQEPVAPKANLTVRVSYLFHCAIPVARQLICRGLGGGSKGQPSGSSAMLEQVMGAESRYKMLSAEATLPNQGAAYYRQGASE